MILATWSAARGHAERRVLEGGGAVMILGVARLFKQVFPCVDREMVRTDTTSTQMNCSW
jgi:hypothetical protein